MKDILDALKPVNKNSLIKDIFTDNPYTKKSLCEWFDSIKKGENPAEIDAKLIESLLQQIKEIESHL